MKKILLLLLLFCSPSFAQKSYEELIVDLEDKAKKGALTWSDLGDIVDTIEGESADPEYRKHLCDLTLMWLDGLLPNTERVSRPSAVNAEPLNRAIFLGDVGSIVRNLVRGVHRTFTRSGPLHAVLRKPSNKDKDPNGLDILRAKIKKTFELEDRLHLLRLILLAGVKLDEKDGDGQTALVLAVLDWPNFVPLLLAAGADPNIADEEGHGPIFHVAHAEKKGSTALKTLQDLIRAGADVNPIYKKGRTLLGEFALLDRGDLIAELLKSGAHPGIKDELGRRPLHWASLMGSVTAMKALLQNLQGDRDALVEYVNAKDDSGMTPLMLALSDIPPELVERIGTIGTGVLEAKLEIIRLLLAAGARVPNETRTELEFAVLYGALEPVELLPKTLVHHMPAEEKLHWMLLALGELPEILYLESWKTAAPSLRVMRQEIFLVMYRMFSLDLTWEQVEMLEAAASANGFDIVLEWLLGVKAWGNPLTLNQKWVLLRQLVKPFPAGVNRNELENYRNARWRILEMVLADPIPLTREQAEYIELEGRANGMGAFFDSPLWQAQLKEATEDTSSPRPRRGSAIPRLIRRVSKLVLPRKFSGESTSQTPKSPTSSSSGESSFDLTRLPKPDRDDHGDRGGGGIGASTF